MVNSLSDAQKQELVEDRQVLVREWLLEQMNSSQFALISNLISGEEDNDKRGPLLDRYSLHLLKQTLAGPDETVTDQYWLADDTKWEIIQNALRFSVVSCICQDEHRLTSSPSRTIYVQGSTLSKMMD